MLTVSCSVLENARKDPAFYVQSLLNGVERKGQQGMFSYWRSVARLIHEKQIEIGEAIGILENKFSRFNPTAANKVKQNGLIESLIRYNREFLKNNFEFEKGGKRILWDIHNEVRLTGNTPWVVKRKNQFYSFLYTEKDFDWTNELRFPLLQNYIAKEIAKCENSIMNIGIYNLENANFDFRVYDEEQIEDAISETRTLFNDVYQQYSKYK